jgi:SAM-dependent methyltransferase
MIAVKRAPATARPHDTAALSADDLYRRAMVGLPGWARDDRDTVCELPLARWAGGHRATPADRRADEQLLMPCTGATLDLGCGPGRLTAALCARGIVALGVDLSATAVDWTNRRGGSGLRRDLFGPLPGTGRWRQVLLADGNIGIGGDPLRLLRRVHALLRPGGLVIAEIDARRTGLRRKQLRWETESAVGDWFPWATVGIDAITDVAAAAALQVTTVQTIAERLIVHLRPADQESQIGP